MNTSETNPYATDDLGDSTPDRWGFVKRLGIAFAVVLIALMMVPHSAGNSQRSTGGVVTDLSFRKYGMPPWLKKVETNGKPAWSVDPQNVFLLPALAGCIALGFVGITSPRKKRDS